VRENGIYELWQETTSGSRNPNPNQQHSILAVAEDLGLNPSVIYDYVKSKQAKTGID
jgi:hypothetical protein